MFALAAFVTGLIALLMHVFKWGTEFNVITVLYLSLGFFYLSWLLVGWPAPGQPYNWKR
jgi:hypothetical protein